MPRSSNNNNQLLKPSINAVQVRYAGLNALGIIDVMKQVMVAKHNLKRTIAHQVTQPGKAFA